jgi:WD40 repeat protein
MSRRTMVASVFSSILIAIVFALVPPSAQAAQPQSSPTDLLGDPLPKHALARLGSTRFHHEHEILKVIYTRDGKSLVAMDSGGRIRVWDAATGRMICAIGEELNHFRQIAVSPDGGTLATIEDPGQLRTWDLANGRERRRWHALAGIHEHLTFSPDGRTLAEEISKSDQTKGEDRFINLWDLSVPTERRRRIDGDWMGLGGLVFSPDGKTLVTGGHDTDTRITGEKPEKGSTRIWDLATGRERARFAVEGFYVCSVAISPDGKLVAAGVSDQTVRIYDLASGLERMPRLGQDHALQPKLQEADAPMPAFNNREDRLVMPCLAFSPDGSILASGSSGTGSILSSVLADVYLWDIARGKELRHFQAHQTRVHSLDFSPNGRTLASTGAEPMIRLWDVAGGREAFPQPGHRTWIRTLAISPADGTVFTGGQDGTIRQWDRKSGRELGVIAGFPDLADPIALSPDGKTLIVGSLVSGRFVLWSIAERREIRSFPRIVPRNFVRYLAFSPDGQTVAADGRIWDAATGRVAVTFRGWGEQKNRELNFFPIFYTSDSEEIIAVDREGVGVWDIASGKEVRRAVQCDIQNYHPALSSDGRFVALGGLDDRRTNRQLDPAIRIFELASGQEVATMRGHETRTRNLAFSPDGRLLASGSVGTVVTKDETVRIWDVATGHELRRFEGHLGPINTVAFAFAPNGRSLVCTSGDATALVWDLSDLAGAPAADRPLAADELKARWAELAGADARGAHRARWALGFPSAVAFLREQLLAAKVGGPNDVPAASGPIGPPDVLRCLRAIAALERVGTPEAQDVLERMAQGSVSALVNRDARSALERLSRLRSARN